jgi:hypothetical protein
MTFLLRCWHRGKSSPPTRFCEKTQLPGPPWLERFRVGFCSTIAMTRWATIHHWYEGYQAVRIAAGCAGEGVYAANPAG